MTTSETSLLEYANRNGNKIYHTYNGQKPSGLNLRKFFVVADGVIEDVTGHVARVCDLRRDAQNGNVITKYSAQDIIEDIVSGKVGQKIVCVTI